MKSHVLAGAAVVLISCSPAFAGSRINTNLDAANPPPSCSVLGIPAAGGVSVLIALVAPYLLRRRSR